MDRTLALLNYTSIFCLLRKLNAVILVGINHYTTDEECTHSVLNKAACAVMNENLKPHYCVRLEELTPEVCCPELLYFCRNQNFSVSRLGDQFLPVRDSYEFGGNSKKSCNFQICIVQLWLRRLPI